MTICNSVISWAQYLLFLPLSTTCREKKDCESLFLKKKKEKKGGGGGMEFCVWIRSFVCKILPEIYNNKNH